MIAAEEEKTDELWQRVASLMTEISARDKTIAEQAAQLQAQGAELRKLRASSNRDRFGNAAGLNDDL